MKSFTEFLQEKRRYYLIAPKRKWEKYSKSNEYYIHAHDKENDIGMNFKAYYDSGIV